MSPGDQLRWLTLWGHRRVQEYMGDEDGVDQVKMKDDGVVALNGGRTRIYMGDVDGVGQVKKEGEGVKLGGGQTRDGIGGLVALSSKPSEGFGGFDLKTIGGRFAGLGLKIRRGRFGELSLKTTGWTVFGFGPQNSGAVPAGIGAGTLRHHEACAKAKLSNEWRVAVGTTDV